MSDALRSDTRCHYYRSTFHDSNDSLMPKLRLIGLTLLHLARLPSHTLKKRAMFPTN